MKHLGQLALIALLFVATPFTTTAQKVKAENVKKYCDSIPLQERPRITVSKFKITNTRIQPQVGEELSAMLLNSIHETQCFQVLESIANLDELFAEIELGQQGVTTAETAPKAGQMKGAQLILSGEITEYAYDYLHAFGAGTHNAHVGFILKIVDPQSRAVVWSKSVEKKVSKPSIKIFTVDIATFTTRAIEDAVEEAMLEATELIVQQKHLFESYKPENNRQPIVTEVDVPKTVTVQNVTFSDLVSIEKVLKNMEGVVEVKKSLKDNIGTLQVYCNRSTDDLAAQLSEKNNGFSLEITAFSEGNIEAKAVK